MKTATFYLLNQADNNDELSTAEKLTCHLTVKKWRQGKRVLIVCEDKYQALKIDEALWINDPYTFVPHNLIGDGPSCGAPVELCWSQCSCVTSRDLLINLLPNVSDFASFFNEIIDFVPDNVLLKQLARNRYKAYLNFGFKLTTTILPIQ